jgi:hypothetical protein
LLLLLFDIVAPVITAVAVVAAVLTVVVLSLEGLDIVVGDDDVVIKEALSTLLLLATVDKASGKDGTVAATALTGVSELDMERSSSRSY